MTIKNVRVIADPPNFSTEDVRNVKNVFSEIIPKHKKFTVYFYRLLLFPNNLALMGTTDPELDDIILDIEAGLEKIHLSDDKVYTNSRYFFSNMTLARFSTPPSHGFINKVRELSESIHFSPYCVDSVTLLSANAVMKKRTIFGTWNLNC
jgi:2'-5' RNA ligase